MLKQYNTKKTNINHATQSTTKASESDRSIFESNGHPFPLDLQIFSPQKENKKIGNFFGALGFSGNDFSTNRNPIKKPEELN